MQKEMQAGTAAEAEADDEELCDTLIAISVVAKRLAREIREHQKTKEGKDV